MIFNDNKIYILDGAMGTMIQKHGLTEEDYHGGPFSECQKELMGNNECLNLTHPEIIKGIHKEYIAAGADIIETNTFSANVISQAEYGCESFAERMAYEGARIAREAADEAAQMAASVGLERKVLVAGSIGPTSKSLSLSPDVADPAFRPYSFDEMKEAYRQQAEALIRGGEMYSAATVAATLDLELLGEVLDDSFVYRATLTHQSLMDIECDAQAALKRIAYRMMNVPGTEALPGYGTKKLGWFRRLFQPTLKEVKRIDR